MYRTYHNRKESSIGGAGIHAGRFLGIGTQWQLDNGIQDDVEIMLQEWQSITGSEPNNRIEHFLSETAETLDWIHSYGIEFEEPQIDIGSGSKPRIHQLSPITEHPLVAWEESLLEQTILNTAVEKIERNTNGDFIIHTNNGKWSAKYVVIATGGFSRNPNIVEDWIPEIQEFNWHMEAWFGMVGDSNEWLEHLEVNIQNKSNIGLYAHSTPDPLLGHPEVMIVTALERSVIVNTNGQRVFDETKTQSLESDK